MKPSDPNRPAPPRPGPPTAPATPPPPPDPKRLARLAARLPDEQLLRECELEFFTAGGPGGQHRNKSETAVRLKHLPTGTVAAASERRSQWQNRSEALTRLRALLTEMGKVQRVRRKTKVPASAKRRRVDAKKKQGQKKRERTRLD